ncbi:hypothetical protein JHK86_055505 [Glycine max]|nr:hypothetical protein JHK86_055505 [Glycine max]
MPDAALLGNFFGSIVVAQLGPPKLDFNLIQCGVEGKREQNRFGGKRREEEMLVARQETCDGRVIAHVDMDCFYVGRNIFRQRLEAGDREADIEQCRLASFPSLSSNEEKFNDLVATEKVDELKKLVASHIYAL